MRGQSAEIGGIPDLLVVGAGPAGLSAAISAKMAGLSVRLLSKAPQRRPNLGESLAPAGLGVLRELGCAELRASGRHQPCPGYSWVWGQPQRQEHSFVADARGSAWHIDRTTFEQALTGRAAQLGVKLEKIAVTPVCVRRDDGWQISDARGRRLMRARYLVDASGRGARVSRQLGMPLEQIDCLQAWWTEVPADQVCTRDRRSLVETTENGWWYSSLGSAGSLSLMLFCDQARLTLAQWRAELAMTISTRHRLSACFPTESSAPKRRSLSIGYHAQPAGEGYYAVGDAALSYDPLAAHGLTFALASGRDAAKAVAAQLQGCAQARAAFGQKIARARSGYLGERSAIYAAERRWPNSDFWRRRIERAGSPYASSVSSHLRPEPIY